jgi:hypothetical protein
MCEDTLLKISKWQEILYNSYSYVWTGDKVKKKLLLEKYLGCCIWQEMNLNQMQKR